MTMSRKGWVPWPVARGARFYTGRMFPAAYRNNIFIAEHGSWNRSRKSGYRIVRVEVDQAGRALRQEVFADGWLQVDPGGPETCWCYRTARCRSVTIRSARSTG